MLAQKGTKAMKIKLGLCNLRHTWKNKGRKISFFQIDTGTHKFFRNNFFYVESNFYLFGFWFCNLKYRKKTK